MSVTKGTVVAAAMLAGGSLAAAQAHPVRSTASLGPRDRAALEAALTRPPKDLQPGDALDHHDAKGVNHPIRTCAQYTRALKAGWSAENNAQMATEGFF